MARISKESVDRFFDYGIYLDQSTLYIGSQVLDEDTESGIDALAAENAIKGLYLLDQKVETPITIILNSLGGDSLHAMAIYDAIKTCKNQVSIKIYGYGMSSAAWILQAADKRIMSKNSRLMIHTGTIALGESHPETSKRWMDQFAKDEVIFEDILLEKIREKKPKFTRQKLKNMLRFDTILTPQEALDLGLIDEVE